MFQNGEMRVTADQLKAVKAIMGDRAIPYYPVLAKALKSTTTALFIRQCIYWSERTKDPEGWFWKSYEEWFEETGFTSDQVRLARKRAKNKGLLEDDHRRKEHKIYYRVDVEAVINLIASYLKAHGQTQSTTWGKSINHMDKSNQPHGESQSLYITKITSESTTKNTTEKKKAGKPAPSKSEDSPTLKDGTPVYNLALSWCEHVGIDTKKLSGPDWSALKSLLKADIGIDDLKEMSLKAEKEWKGKGRKLLYLNSNRASLLSGTSKPQGRRYATIDDLIKEEKELQDSK